MGVVQEKTQAAVATLIVLGALASGCVKRDSRPPPTQVQPPVAILSAPQDVVVKLCKEVSKAIESYKWDVDACAYTGYKVGGQSVRGHPLLYAEFGNPKALNRTLILSMVHGDEITPLYISLKLADFLTHNYASKKDIYVVVAPLVNPDSFLRKTKTRVNANGVDVNRNFATADWHDRALKAWKQQFRSHPRRFPGFKPDSEPETVFQKKLIDEFKPEKIISIHAPLNVLDYDGPTQLTLGDFPKEYIHQINELKSKVRAKSTGYFPGSLGNYSGNNLAIPTFTLELPTSNPRFAETYWKKFQSGIRTVIEHPLK